MFPSEILPGVFQEALGGCQRPGSLLAQGSHQHLSPPGGRTWARLFAGFPASAPEVSPGYCLDGAFHQQDTKLEGAISVLQQNPSAKTGEHSRNNTYAPLPFPRRDPRVMLLPECPTSAPARQHGPIYANLCKYAQWTQIYESARGCLGRGDPPRSAGAAPGIRRRRRGRPGARSCGSPGTGRSCGSGGIMVSASPGCSLPPVPPVHPGEGWALRAFPGGLCREPSNAGSWRRECPPCAPCLCLASAPSWAAPSPALSSLPPLGIPLYPWQGGHQRAPRLRRRCSGGHATSHRSPTFSSVGSCPCPAVPSPAAGSLPAPHAARPQLNSCSRLQLPSLTALLQGWASLWVGFQAALPPWSCGHLWLMSSPAALESIPAPRFPGHPACCPAEPHSLPFLCQTLPWRRQSLLAGEQPCCVLALLGSTQPVVSQRWVPQSWSCLLLVVGLKYSEQHNPLPPPH